MRLKNLQLLFALILLLLLFLRLVGQFLHALPLLGGLASFLAAALTMFSTIGIVSTTILGWRKEKRELKIYERELAKKELEIIKLRHEVEQLQQSQVPTDIGASDLLKRASGN